MGGRAGGRLAGRRTMSSAAHLLWWFSCIDPGHNCHGFKDGIAKAFKCPLHFFEVGGRPLPASRWSAAWPCPRHLMAGVALVLAYGHDSL